MHYETFNLKTNVGYANVEFLCVTHKRSKS